MRASLLEERSCLQFTSFSVLSIPVSHHFLRTVGTDQWAAGSLHTINLSLEGGSGKSQKSLCFYLDPSSPSLPHI